MSMISKVSQVVINGASKASAKYLNTALKTTSKASGVPVTTYHKTGTQVAKLADGTKSITLGARNGLSRILGEGATITSYPKGTFFGGNEGLILLQGKNGKGLLSFLPKEFGEFVQMMKNLAKIS